jgi:hypothetical protein
MGVEKLSQPLSLPINNRGILPTRHLVKRNRSLRSDSPSLDKEVHTKKAARGWLIHFCTASNHPSIPPSSKEGKSVCQYSFELIFFDFFADHDFFAPGCIGDFVIVRKAEH